MRTYTVTETQSNKQQQRRHTKYSTDSFRTAILRTIATMPQVPNQAGTQDWGSVNVGSGAAGSGYKKTGIATKEKRHGAGGNSSAHGGGIMSARKVR